MNGACGYAGRSGAGVRGFGADGTGNKGARMEKVLSIVAEKPRKNPGRPSSRRMVRMSPHMESLSSRPSSSPLSRSAAWMRVLILRWRYWRSECTQEVKRTCQEGIQHCKNMV
jgi:hypothetical protein